MKHLKVLDAEVDEFDLSGNNPDIQPSSEVGEAVIRFQNEMMNGSPLVDVGITYVYTTSGPPRPYFSNAEGTRTLAENLSRNSHKQKKLNL